VKFPYQDEKADHHQKMQGTRHTQGSRDPDAPRLFVPAMLRPNAAIDVFERAIARRAAVLPSPWAVLLSPPRLFSVADAVLIDRGRLSKWLEAHP